MPMSNDMGIVFHCRLGRLVLTGTRWAEPAPLCSEIFNFLVKMKGMWAEPAELQLTWLLGDLVH